MADTYSAATGSVDITPQAPIALAGYATLRKPTFDRIADPLEANVIVLRSGDAVLVFVALDLMYVGAYLEQEISKRLADSVPHQALLTTAIHTHFGPPTEDSLPVLGAVTPAYRDLVAQRVTELASRLLAGPFTDVSLEYLEHRAAYSVNRRKKTFGFGRRFPFVGSQVRIKADPAGRRDDTIRMIRVRDGRGATLAVCWSYACHPVSFPELNELSAEYPGVVRESIRASFGNIPVVFWQGFSGNIVPLQTASAPGTAGPQAPRRFRAHTLDDWQQWARSLGRCAVEALGGPRRTVAGPISCSEREVPLSQLGLSSGKLLRLHEIYLGPDLVICGLNAEVAVEYVEVLQALYAPARVIPVGCVGDVFGYLPVDAMVREGGYEACGFLPRFGLQGHFLPNINAIVAEQLLRPRPGVALSESQRASAQQRGADVVQRGGEGGAATRAMDV